MLKTKIKIISFVIVSLLTISLTIFSYNGIALDIVTPISQDMDDDGVLDIDEDITDDGILDPGKTDSTRPDTDSDGFLDGEEINLGFDPSDENFSPIMYPEILDQNKDGIVDLNLTNDEIFEQSGMIKVESENIASFECDKTDLVLFRDDVSCIFKLQSPKGNNFTFGEFDFRIIQENSDFRSVRCDLVNNNTDKASIHCNNVYLDEFLIGQEKLKLYQVNKQKVQSTINQDISLNITFDPNYSDIKLVDSQLDEQIIKKCEPAEPGTTTTCTFDLSYEYVLPDDYQLGIGVEPGGFCTRDGQVYTCSEVPVGDLEYINEIQSTIGTSSNFSFYPKDHMHTDTPVEELFWDATIGSKIMNYENINQEFN
ncbi:MAG: hypothetical protein ACRCXZ_01090, partial [Patescibacteria group bacterium]